MRAASPLRFFADAILTHSFGEGRDKEGMTGRLDQAHRFLPMVLGVLTMAGVVVLLIWDVHPALFHAGAHDFLGAFPLALIALAYLVYQLVRRPRPAEMVKAVLLAAAFFLWAANQFWADSPRATLFNDLAIALFVLDVFLVIAGWPSAEPDESFAESHAPSAVDRDA